MDQDISAMVSNLNNACTYVLQDKFAALHGTNLTLGHQSKKYCWYNVNIKRLTGDAACFPRPLMLGSNLGQLQASNGMDLTLGLNAWCHAACANLQQVGSFCPCMYVN